MKGAWRIRSFIACTAARTRGAYIRSVAPTRRQMVRPQPRIFPCMSRLSALVRAAASNTTILLLREFASTRTEPRSSYSLSQA